MKTSKVSYEETRSFVENEEWIIANVPFEKRLTGRLLHSKKFIVYRRNKAVLKTESLKEAVEAFNEI